MASVDSLLRRARKLQGPSSGHELLTLLLSAGGERVEIEDDGTPISLEMLVANDYQSDKEIQA